MTTTSSRADASAFLNWTTAGPEGLPIPLSVSWHLWPDCNFACTYCFATFRDIPGTLSEVDAKRVLDRLREAGTQKVSFVGGEPTLCRHLPELIRHAKEIGLVTMLVTNGSRLDAAYRARVVPWLDWVSISIDAGDPEVMAAIGRGNVHTLRRTLMRIEALAAEPHLRLKINTVVNRLNLHDDMRDLIRRLRPDRWKVFQVLPVGGQNDGKVEPLLISRDEFLGWVERHQELEAEGFGPVVEDNDDLTGTYLMLDPLGRFFTNKTGAHVYTDPLLEVGVWEAIRQVGWDTAGYLARGGLYDWGPSGGRI